jgi:hypothetical protein
MARELSSDEFEQLVAKSAGTVVLEFSAPW